MPQLLSCHGQSFEARDHFWEPGFFYSMHVFILFEKKKKSILGGVPNGFLLKLDEYTDGIRKSWISPDYS